LSFYEAIFPKVKMNIFSIIKSITSHPLNQANKLAAIIRFIKWQVVVRLNPYPIIYQWTIKSRLIVKRSMTGATGNLYCGMQDFEDMGFLLHFLREEDLFIDVGANIGSYSVLASSHVGADTLAFEPTSNTFKYLEDNIRLNNISDKVNAFSIALGSVKGTCNLSNTQDGMNNHVSIENDSCTQKVKMEKLDDLINNYQMPILIKIDVEGYETEVIKGAQQLLQNQTLKAVIIELMGLGERYGFNEIQIHKQLLSYGFQAIAYDPIKRSLIPLDYFGKRNTIYIRDLEFITHRIQSAPQIEIFGHVF